MTKTKSRIRNEDVENNPKLVSLTDSDNELRIVFQRIYCNFIERSIKYEVENKIIRPSPVAAVADVQVGEKSTKPAVNAEIKTVSDDQLATSPTSAEHQTKGKRPIRSVSDIFIDLSQRVEELPDKIIRYNRAETLTSEDMIGTNFQLDESMSDCRSVYYKLDTQAAQVAQVVQVAQEAQVAQVAQTAQVKEKRRLSLRRRLINLIVCNSCKSD